MTTVRMNSCRGSELGGVSTDRQAGWTLISPRMFDRTECKNNTNPSGPYGWFWEDQLLRAFKAIIFISHPQWAILISDERPVVRKQEDNEQEKWTTCVHPHLDFCILPIGMSPMLYFSKSNKTNTEHISYILPLCSRVSNSDICTWTIPYQTNTATKLFTCAVIHAMFPVYRKQISCILKLFLGSISITRGSW